MLLLGETSDTLCQFARDSKSKAYDSPDLRQKFWVFEIRSEKKYVVSKMENIVKKNKFVLQKNVRYTKCALYQMYAKLRLNLQR